MRRASRSALLASAGLAVILIVSGGLWWRHGRTIEPPIPATLRTASAPVRSLIERALEDVRSAPREPDRWYRLGLVYSANGVVEPAMRTFEQTVELDPDAVRAWYHLALIREVTSDVDGAVEAMESVVQRAPGYFPAHWRLGGWQLDRGRPDAARRAFDAAAALAPGGEQVAIGRARLALLADDPHAAIAMLEPVAWRDAAPHPLVHQLLAAARVRTGDSRGAARSLALTRCPVPAPRDPWLAELDGFRVDAAAQVAEARATAESGRLEEAIRQMEVVVEQQPNNPAIRCNIAALHRARGDHRRSREVLHAVLEAHPESWRAYYNLALTHRAEFGGADGRLSPEHRPSLVALVESALRCNPAHAPSMALRGDLHAMEGEHDRASTCYRSASVAEPENAGWLLRLGESEVRCGRPADAIAVLHSADRMAPNDPRILRALAGALALSGHSDEAEVVGRRARQAMLNASGGGRIR